MKLKVDSLKNPQNWQTFRWIEQAEEENEDKSRSKWNW